MIPKEVVRRLRALADDQWHIEPARLLDEFGTVDGVQFGFELLSHAVAHEAAADVEYSLIACFMLGVTDRHLPSLLDLAWGDWHMRHEDVATALSEMKSSATVDALLHLAQWVPDYLDFDDARALAVKAIWGLGAIESDDAQNALQVLAQDKNEVVRRNAAEQLARRGEGHT